MKIVPRSQWGAAPPKSRTTTTWANRTEFVVHYSEGPTSQTPKSIQAFHMGPARGWSDVGYNFLVDVDGRVFEGRGWLTVGAHATSHNTSGVGVCFIGRNGDATPEALAAIRDLYDAACEKAGRKLTLRGHGQLSGNSTSCPGAQLLDWIRDGAPRPGAAKPSPPKGAKPARLLKLTDPMMRGEDVRQLQKALNLVQARPRIATDGVFGSGTEAAVKRFQRAKKLAADGMVGPATRAALTKATAKG